MDHLTPLPAAFTDVSSGAFALPQLWLSFLQGTLSWESTVSGSLGEDASLSLMLSFSSGLTAAGVQAWASGQTLKAEG